MQQHVTDDAYTVDVTPDCRNGQNEGVTIPDPQTLDYTDTSLVTFPSLGMYILFVTSI